MPDPSHGRTPPVPPTRTGRRPRADDGAARRRALRRARGALWRARFVVAAVCCGLAAALIVQALRPAAPQTVEVVVPTHRLEAGRATRAQDLETRTVAAAIVPDDVLTDPAPVVGRAPAVDLPAGLPLHDDLLPGGGVVAQAPKGTVVVPVRLDDPATGWLHPGDHVDLLSRAGGSPGDDGREDGRAGDGAGDGDGDEDGQDDGTYLARRALVLPGPTADPAGESGSGGLLDVGGGTATAGDVTLVAVSPDDAPRLSAASGWGTIGAVLVP